VRHPAHLIAFAGGVGLIPYAPGTFGTLLALPIYWLLGPRVDPAVYLASVGVLFMVGVWACEVTGRNLGHPDHGGMVWDETVAFLLVLFFTPFDMYWQAFAFLVFRVFDIAKPPPIRYYERVIKGGWGVMLDDILSAIYTIIVLKLARMVF